MNFPKFALQKFFSLKKLILLILFLLSGFMVSAQIFYAAEENYFACDTDGDGYVSISFEELQNYALDVLEEFNESPEIYVTRAHGGIEKITNLYNNPQIANVCNDIDGMGGYYDIAINNQQEIYVVRQNGLLQKVNTQFCTLQDITYIHNGSQSVLALSFDHLNHLYEGGWTSKVYRADAQDLQQFYLWHDLGEGRAAGDFVQIGDFLYVAWTMPNGKDYLYKVSLGANNQYVSHENLGQIDSGTYGLAAEYGKLYGNTPDYLYEIDLNSMETTMIRQRNNPNSYAGEWWGAAGFHEALNLEISYHNSPENAEIGSAPLSDPYVNENPYSDRVYIRVHEATEDTTYIIPVQITVVSAPSAFNTNLTECKDELSGLATFQLSDAENQINTDADVFFAYFENLENLEDNQNSLPLNYATENSKTLYVKVYKSAQNCYGIAELELIVPSADNVIYEENVRFCLGTNAILSIPDEFNSYQWNGLQEDDLYQPTDSNEVTISHPGSYSVKVTDANGCTYTLPFEAVLGGSPEITKIKNNGNSITVEVSPAGNYEYSLDGVFWQSSATFYNIEVADYDIYVRDLVGCYSEPYKFTYFLVPNFISPNGDGKNDFWEIRGLELYPDARFKIFDRYGKIFADRKANFNGIIWDGKYLGNPVPSGTYWYIIELEENNKITGFISVKN